MKPRLLARGVGPLFAVALHGALLTYLFVASPPVAKSQPRKEPVRIRTVTRAAEPPKVALPAPVPEPAPAPKPESRPAREPAKRLAKAPQPRPAPKVAAALPPPPARSAEPPPQLPPPAPVDQAATAEAVRPRKFTVALGATVGPGGVAVPVSRTGSLFGVGGGEGVDPDEADSGTGLSRAAGAGSARVDISELTSPPRLLSQPTPEQMREVYPEDARREGLEADVSLRILVSSRGEVLKVRVVRQAGAGFDDAAQKLIKQFRFAAAEVGGQPVEVWIPWTYKFRPEG